MMKKEELRWQAIAFLVASLQNKQFFGIVLNFLLRLYFAKHGALTLNLEMKAQSNNNPLVPKILHMWGIPLYVFTFEFRRWNCESWKKLLWVLWTQRY